MVAETCVSNIVVTQKHTKTINLFQLGHGIPYFAGTSAKRLWTRQSVSFHCQKRFSFGQKRCQTLGKQVLQSGVDFALDVLHGKNAKQAAIDQAKLSGSNLLQMAKQKVGKRKTP